MFSVLQCSFFTLGMCILSGLAYAFPAWKHIAYTSSSVLVPLLVIMWFAPESPRWNLLNDRLEETYDLFLNILGDSPAKMKMAQVFVKRLEAVQKSELKEYRLETGSGLRESIRKVFQTKQMRNKMLLMTYEWATAQTVYIGLGYYGPGIHENPYLAFFLSSAVEFLCFPVAYWYMHRVGRRPAYALSTGTSAALMAVFLVAKLSIAAAFLITIPYAGELYPTELRAFGFSVGSVLGGLVCSPAPLVVYLGASNLALPLIIFGCLAVAGGILSLLLPETLGKAMPQTVQEADENKLIPFSSAFSPQGIKSLFTVKA
ncbi:unnamed protein product [Notodromas monacha]|uniref:Uncharacterized protein n=1 Tax=Notodromas monacha TaxID=399045 RepID=A0A7R9BV94_9CRUS|nr:unnamed protein product [Notodromas monacha]CAG0920762.1 unnamed protein product [Notodromas monacha]